MCPPPYRCPHFQRQPRFGAGITVGPLSCSFTGPDEMKINRDRSHPNRVDTYLKYYDDNGDGHVHKHEFDAKHSDL